MKNKFPTFLNFMLILFFFIIFTIPFSIATSHFPKSLKTFAMLVSYVFPMILTIWVTKKYFNLKGKSRFKVSHLQLLPIVILAAYAFLLIGEFTVSILPEPTGIVKKLFDQMEKAMTTIFDDKIFGFLMVAVAAPILEEMLFRGIILKYLLKKYAPWTAILLTAVAFGVFHLNPWQFMYATTVGILLGYMYWKTNNLFYPILIHFILNGTAFVVSQFVDMEANEGVAQAVGDDNSFYIAVVFSVALIYFLYLFVEKYFAKQQKILVLATQNAHKIEEIKKILPDNIQLSSLKELGFVGELKETGKTLDANAKQKMKQIAVPYAVDALADDTGLEVEALNGDPGVYSARYSGANATYQTNVDKLLQQMQGVENRKAQFRTVIALSIGAEDKYFEGIIKGKIAIEPKGTNGFGYDSVFIPEGETRTFAQMTDDEKNEISHRANALKKMKKYFEEKSV